MDTGIDWTSIVTYVLSASGVFAWLSAAVNKSYENKYVSAIMKFINVLGGNIWKAKNKQ